MIRNYIVDEFSEEKGHFFYLVTEANRPMMDHGLPHGDGSLGGH